MVESARNGPGDRQRTPSSSVAGAAFAWRFSLAAVAGIIMPTKPTIIELDMDKLEEILRRVEAKDLQRGRLRDDPHGDRVLCRPLLCRGRQEHHDPPIAEDAFWREDREDRGGDGGGKGFAASADAGCHCCGGISGERGGSYVGGGHGSREDGRRAGQGARPQWGRRLRGRREDRGASRVAPAGRSLPEVRNGHGLRHGPSGRAGAVGGPGPDRGRDLLSPEAALQSVRRRLHRRVAARAWTQRRSTTRRSAA